MGFVNSQYLKRVYLDIRSTWGEMAASGLADFIFVKSTTKSEVYTKKAAWPAGEFEIVNYEPIEDDEKEWVSKEVKEQISSTVSNVRAKQLKDTDSVYIVLGVTAKFVPNENNPSKTRKQVFDPLMLNVLKRLSANILAYLNTEHTKLLVSCPIWKLTEALDKERYAKKYFEGIKRIGPLLPMEQISKFLRQNSAWAKESRELIIQLIPNLPTEKREAYSKNITDYLKSVDSNASSYEGSDFILANIKQKPAEDLLKTSNFIFKLFEVPEGFAERVKLPEKKPSIRKRKGIRASGSSAVDSSLGNLPTVCILDSGVTEIPQLKGFLVTQDGYGFSNLNDDYKNHGHGTPIAYLAIFGEVPSVAKARVISYKIYSDVNKRVYPEGYRRAIAKYSNPESPFRTKIFLSSISFKDDNSEVTAYIDRLIQENNVCAVFAAGNIDPRIVSNYAFDGVPCSSYVCNHPLQDTSSSLKCTFGRCYCKKGSVEFNFT